MTTEAVGRCFQGQWRRQVVTQACNVVHIRLDGLHTASHSHAICWCMQVIDEEKRLKRAAAEKEEEERHLAAMQEQVRAMHRLVVWWHRVLKAVFSIRGKLAAVSSRTCKARYYTVMAARRVLG